MRDGMQALSNGLLFQTQLSLRRALGVGFGMFLAVWLNHYFARTQEFWVPLATLLVMQMSIRTHLRLALQRFIIMVIAVGIGSYVVWYLHDFLMSLIVLSAFFVMACYWHERYAVEGSLLSAALMSGLLVLVLVIPAPSYHFSYERMSDVVLGGVIGLLCGLWVLPGRADVDFRIGVIAIFQAYERYLMSVADLFFQESHREEILLHKRNEVERVLQIQQADFPDWVYERGFNLALREGHRHFLLRTEQVGTILLAMHHVARQPVDPALLSLLRQPLTLCIDQTLQIMNSIIVMLDLKTPPAPMPDVVESMQILEAAFRRAVPLSLELLDISPEYVSVSAFIYDLKDLQKTLLKLIEALR